jgi:hypothetical protein
VDEISPRISEFCYLVRYPEKHGRNLSNPWSMRQLAVFQTYNCRTKTSSWIFLQCPQPLQKLFLDAAMMNGNQSLLVSAGEPNAALLEFILIRTSAKWRDYVNDFEAEITVLVRIPLINSST